MENFIFCAVIKDCYSKCYMPIYSHLQKKSITENFIYCTVPEIKLNFLFKVMCISSNAILYLKY